MTWIIGAGQMAIEYAKVLAAQSRGFEVFGRSQQGCRRFTEATGVPARAGGLDALAREQALPEQAIVAVGVEDLAEVTQALLGLGVPRILVEKPGALTRQGISAIAEAAGARGAEVFIAYNRRFYASVRRARELIRSDGGVVSFHFELSEWGHRIGALQKDPQVLERWFLANTTHVADLAWFLGGRPAEITCYHSGSLPWHPSASRFSGAGRTQPGVTFAYYGAWDAPGRWSLEFLTSRRRLIFRPMEELRVQRLDSLEVVQEQLEADRAGAYKPGVYEQVEAFMTGNTADLCSVHEQLRHWDLYERMAGYETE